jgi:hypothetical protein
MQIMLVQKPGIGAALSGEFDWDFGGADNAKAEIRAAVRYLLKGTTGRTRDAIALEVMEILRQVATGLPTSPVG